MLPYHVELAIDTLDRFAIHYQRTVCLRDFTIGSWTIQESYIVTNHFKANDCNMIYNNILRNGWANVPQTWMVDWSWTVYKYRKF